MLDKHVDNDGNPEEKSVEKNVHKNEEKSVGTSINNDKKKTADDIEDKLEIYDINDMANDETIKNTKSNDSFGKHVEHDLKNIKDSFYLSSHHSREILEGSDTQLYLSSILTHNKEMELESKNETKNENENFHEMKNDGDESEIYEIEGIDISKSERSEIPEKKENNESAINDGSNDIINSNKEIKTTEIKLAEKLGNQKLTPQTCALKVHFNFSSRMSEQELVEYIQDKAIICKLKPETIQPKSVHQSYLKRLIFGAKKKNLNDKVIYNYDNVHDNPVEETKQKSSCIIC